MVVLLLPKNIKCVDFEIPKFNHKPCMVFLLLQVAEYMMEHSTSNNPVIVGSSVHNIRIERLWRDTFRCVLSVFYQPFHFLEECGKLDSMSESDLFCLHFVYLPRINKALEDF